MYDPDSFEEELEITLKDKINQKWLEFKMWVECIIKKLGG